MIIHFVNFIKAITQLQEISLQFYLLYLAEMDVVMREKRLRPAKIGRWSMMCDFGSLSADLTCEKLDGARSDGKYVDNTKSMIKKSVCILHQNHDHWLILSKELSVLRLSLTFASEYF